MGKSRRDVIFYDTDPKRANNAGKDVAQLCVSRVVSSPRDLKAELEKRDPDMLVYIEHPASYRDLSEIKKILDHPKYAFLRTILATQTFGRDNLVDYFPSEKITVHNIMERTDNYFDRLKAIFDEIDEEPQVLVVDPDRDRRNEIIAKLEDSCNAVGVDSAEDVALFPEFFVPDVIFVQQEQTDSDGLECSDKLRQYPNFAKAAFVMIAESVDKQQLRQCIQKKIRGFLLQSFQPEELRAKISDLMGEKEAPKIKRTVLAVDDDVMILKTLQSILEDEFRVVAVNGGDQALKYTANHVPDLVLLDYEMPGINGIYVLRKLRMDARFNQCPVVMLTGNKTRETVVECIQCGAQGYLTKPVTPLSLKLRLRQYLGGVQG